MKTSVRNSSLEAYDSLKTVPLGNQQRQVLAGVAMLLRTRQDVDGWVSRRQIATVTGMETATVSARVYSLIAAGRLIESEVTRPCPITGRNVHMIAIPAPEGRKAA